MRNGRADEREFGIAGPEQGAVPLVVHRGEQRGIAGAGHVWVEAFHVVEEHGHRHAGIEVRGCMPGGGDRLAAHLGPEAHRLISERTCALRRSRISRALPCSSWKKSVSTISRTSRCR